MRILPIIILAALIGGCQSPTQFGAAGSVASSTIAGDLNAIRSDLALFPANTKGADAAAADAQGQLPAVDKGLAQVPVLAKSLSDERKHWVGYPIRQAAWWTLIIAGILIVVLVVLYFATGFGPVIGEAATFVFHILTGGLAKLGQVVTNKMSSKLATARANTPVSVWSIGGTPVQLNPAPAPGSSLVSATPIPPGI